MRTSLAAASAILFVLINPGAILSPRALSTPQEQELVANLAAGRVVFFIAADGMLVGALGNPIEAEALPPAVIALSSRRVGVLLGAVEWTNAAAADKPIRLGEELQKAIRELSGPSPGRLRQDDADDVERVGLALLEPLRKVVESLHHRLDFGAEEPLVELLLAGYVEGYGPEVWSLRYRIRQDPLRGSYWRTRVLRPMYTQLYPPEKGQPRTLIEVRYPADDPGPAITEMLAQNDPRLAGVRSSGPETMAVVAHLLKGESQKSKLANATQFLRATLDALASPQGTQVVAMIEVQRGFQWVLAPPEPAEKAADESKREPGAPTLRKRP